MSAFEAEVRVLYSAGEAHAEARQLPDALGAPLDDEAHDPRVAESGAGCEGVGDVGASCQSRIELFVYPF